MRDSNTEPLNQNSNKQQSKKNIEQIPASLTLLALPMQHK
jgi:hypothetical protein